MKIGSNCFLVNCDKAKTMRNICTLIDDTGYHWIVSVQSNPIEKYYVLPQHLRPPKAGEVQAGVRLFD